MKNYSEKLIEKKMKRFINLIKSETWVDMNNIEHQENVLNDLLDTVLSSNQEIINIQLVEENGLKRFWVYLRNRLEINNKYKLL